jgi:branched-chain amino acid transport system substrate-binding protein
MVQQPGQTRRTFLKTSGLAATAALVGGPTVRALAQSVVKIGVVFPMTGSLAQTGRLNRSGTELAVDIVNTRHPDLTLPFAASEGIPKLGNAKIEVVWGDTQGDPNVARSEVERLIENERVVAVMGGWTSAEIKTGSQAAERLKTPYLSGAGSSTDLTRRGLRYYFRLCPHLQTTAESFFQFVTDVNRTEKLDLRTVAIVYENSEYGTVAFDEFKRVAGERGFRVVTQVAFPKDTTSVLSEVMKLKAAGPDIFVHAGYVSDSILFTKAMQNLNFLPKVWFGLTGYDDPTFFSSVGKLANGASLRGFFNPRLRKDVVRKVNELYKKKNGVELSMASALTFNEPFVMADAINRAGSLDKDAIRDALEKTNIPGDQTIMPWESIRFTPYTPAPGHSHDNMSGRNLVFQIQEGKQEIVWPFDVATAKTTVPLKPFDQR